jgi:hypothetical protein
LPAVDLMWSTPKITNRVDAIRRKSARAFPMTSAGNICNCEASMFGTIRTQMTAKAVVFLPV